MEDAVIVGALIVGLYLLKKHLDANSIAPSGIPTAAGISSGPTTSGAYQVTSPATGFVLGYSAPSSSGTVPSPIPPPPPPPPFYGGTVGGVGSGGNPLGGTLRAGVSAGTATTVVRAPGATTVYDFATGTTGFRAPVVKS